MNDAMKAFRGRCASFFQPLWPGEDKVIVFGEGNAEKPRLMLIGEAPGEQEVMQGKPFVGKAGKNLDAFLESVHLKREDIYISNVVKIRPTKVSEKGRVSNRPPNKEEIGLFLPWLKEEIALVSPDLLVTLGNVALRSLLGKGTIGDAHGRFHHTAISASEDKVQEYPLFALYHPASIIYNRALSEVYARDLNALDIALKDGTSAFIVQTDS
jgi:DNA polymerase